MKRAISIAKGEVQGVGYRGKVFKIAENMERILEELKEERKEYRESIEKLVNAIIESKKNNKNKL